MQWETVNYYLSVIQETCEVHMASKPEGLRCNLGTPCDEETPNFHLVLQFLTARMEVRHRLIKLPIT
jgi:hypothetical protein